MSDAQAVLLGIGIAALAFGALAAVVAACYLIAAIRGR